MKSIENKKSFGKGLLFGLLVLSCLGLTIPESQEKSDEYHLTFYSGGTPFVYNAKTGEFKKLKWGDINKGGNLKVLLEK
nr:hypothetical protein [uncultured Allomuricauda sp.]